MWTTLKSMREEKAYSRAELGEAVGTSAHTIWSLERGITKAPHPKTIRRLAEFFEVSPDVIRAAIVADEAA